MNDSPPEDIQPEPTPSIVCYRCPNCGQTYFCAADQTPPDICSYCRDMTTWQRYDPA